MAKVAKPLENRYCRSLSACGYGSLAEKIVAGLAQDLLSSCLYVLSNSLFSFVTLAAVVAGGRLKSQCL